MIDSKRRAEIERLLVLRAVFLVPKEEVIARALRRCVKHSANFVLESGEQALMWISVPMVLVPSPPMR